MKAFVLSEAEQQSVETVLRVFKELSEEKREYLAGFLDGVAAMTIGSDVQQGAICETSRG